jgi:CubicO group peptidase (beta-lactamase class C family)
VIVRHRSLTLAVGVAVVCVAVVAAVVLAPRPARLGPETTGDPELAAATRAATGDGRGYLGIAVAVVEDGEVRAAGLGRSGSLDHPLVTASMPFDIGSVAKALTGMLLADRAVAGDVRLDQPVSDLLPQASFADPRAGSATLAELASHRSGLPRLPIGGPIDLARSAITVLIGSNPYPDADPQAVVAAAARSEATGTPGEFAYSNLGVALLGQALATEAGVPYPSLLDQRILAPLGMRDTTILTPGVEPPPGRASGHTPSGRGAAIWRDWGYAPAGIGVWSTSGDLARLLAGVMESSAPGSDAARPRFKAGEDERIALGWFTSRYGDREVTWHNGGTGGFRSFIGFDRSTARGVVVLANTDTWVDAVGLRLLGVRVPASDASGWSWRTALVVVYSLWGLTLLSLASRGPDSRWRVLRKGKPADRLRLASAVAGTAALLAIAHRVGDVFGVWLQVPPAIWIIGVGLAAVGAFLVVLRWRDLPTSSSGRPWLRWAGTTVSIVISAAIIILIVAA